MATAVESKTRALVPEQRVVLRGIGWEGYETMLKLVGNGAIRLTYDLGGLELMSPSFDRERYKRLLGRVVEIVSDELGIPCLPAGSTTWRKQAEDRGLEADDCFYLASFPLIGDKTPDLSIDPPPDLAIEIEISRSALDRLGIYAALGMPEVWRFDGETFRVEQLQENGDYATVSTSPNFPLLPLDEVAHWLRLSNSVRNVNEWGRRFGAWVRETLAPRR
jgi:Uma2 family endonuclease